MKQVALFILFIVSLATYSQKKHTISGVVSDASNGEKMLGVNIIIKELNTGTYTNEYGFYSITLPDGKYTITVDFMGFETIVETITLDKNIRKDYKISPQAVELDAVEITANASQKVDIRKPEMSTVSVPISTIKKLPVLVGEVDIVKSLMQLPGVSNAGEASSGFNVRGGGADQNLVLLDEAVIFNSSHLFGFLSVFNADAVRDMKLYKGSIPARYGGRISSVLDIYQKEGNRNDFGMTGGIGVLSSRLLAEGPIVKDKASFLFGGRASYAHLFLKLRNNDNTAYFYDLNTKLSYQLNQNNTFYLSGYFGRDLFELSDVVKNVYGNALFNLRWNHIFNSRLFSNLSLIFSDYYYGFRLDPIEFQWDSGIKNLNLKYDFRNYISEKWKVSYGVQGLLYKFMPGKLSPTTPTSAIKELQLPNKYALETGMYIDSEHNLTSSLSASFGLRLSSFYHLGSRRMHVYKDDEAVVFNRDLQIYQEATPIGSTYYHRGKIIDLFSNLEPRFALAYALDDDKSIKASYARTSQYLHLITNTSSPTPLDVWAPSDRFLKPQKANQFAIGFANNLAEDKYSLEVEAYYKLTKNRLDYIDGANLIAKEDIERVILSGRSRAYGLEVLFRKNTGKLAGWIAYTLSNQSNKPKDAQRKKSVSITEIGTTRRTTNLTTFPSPLPML